MSTFSQQSHTTAPTTADQFAGLLELLYQDWETPDSVVKKWYISKRIDEFTRSATPQQKAQFLQAMEQRDAQTLISLLSL